MSDGLSATRLRKLKDPPLTAAQFRSYRQFLPIPEDGKWPAELGEWFAEIIRLRGLEPSIARRVVRFRGTLGYRVPAEILRQAMRQMVPNIQRRAEKMRRIHDATIRGDTKALHLHGRAGSFHDFRVPAVRQWLSLLTNASAEQFERITEWKNYWADMLEVVMRDSPHAVSDIPLEERVVLMTIRDLAIAEYLAPREAQQRAAEVAAEDALV